MPGELIDREIEVKKILERMKKWVSDAEKLRDWEIRKISELEKELPLIKNNLSIHKKQIKIFLFEITKLEKEIENGG